MSKTIIEHYINEIHSEEIIKLPQNAKILSVINKDEKICLSIFIDKNEPKIERTFQVVKSKGNTNNVNPEKFIGTVQLGQNLLFHVFEK